MALRPLETINFFVFVTLLQNKIDPYLRNLKLADAGIGGDIDLLIGADFYWV